MDDSELKAEFDRIELAHNQANGECLARRAAMRKASRKKKKKEEPVDHMHDGMVAGALCEICGEIIIIEDQVQW
jgi:hypothetical protein